MVSGSIISNYGRFLVAFWEVSGSIPLCFSSWFILGGWRVGRIPRVAWGWSGPILLPGNYPGTTRDLGWLRWGVWPGWVGRERVWPVSKEYCRLLKNYTIQWRIQSFSEEFDRWVTQFMKVVTIIKRKRNNKSAWHQTCHNLDVFALHICPTFFETSLIIWALFRLSNKCNTINKNQWKMKSDLRI